VWDGAIHPKRRALVIGRPSRVALFVLTATVASMNAAPASADLIDLDDPILPLPKVQLPDVRELPIVRDVPIVEQLPDVRELPVVRDVADPVATPAPAAPTMPSSPAAPAVTPAPSSESGARQSGGSTSGRESTPAGSSTPAPASNTRGATPAGGRSRDPAPGTGTRRRPTRIGEHTRAAGTPPTSVVRRERRLRRTVRRLSGCLGALATSSRRVLVLRAGIGEGGPLSRRAVAERLDATVSQVVRDERQGLRDLRGAARAGSCGAVAATGPAGPAESAPPTGGGSGTPAARAAGGSDSAVGETGPQGRSGVQEEFRDGPTRSPVTIVARVADGPPVLLALVLAFLAGFGAVWLHGNSRSGAAAVRLRRRDGARHR